MEVREVNHSIANRFNGYIEVNKHLRKYPELLNPILEHEMEHTDKAWSVQDFKLDFFSSDGVNQWKLLKFMFRHPSSFVQLSPILYSKKKGFIIDLNLLTMYSIMLLVFFATLYLGGKYL